MFTDLLDRLSELDAMWLLLAAAIVPFAESLPLVDTFAPGDVGMSVLGIATVGRSQYLVLVIVLASCACVAGDTVAYWLGRRWGRGLVEREGRVARRLRPGVDRAEASLSREGWRGGWSVFAARWVGILRGIYPFVCGMARMPFPKFVAWAAPAAVAWCTALVSVGFFFGDAIARFLDRAGYVVIGVAAVVAFVMFLRHRRAKVPA